MAANRSRREKAGINKGVPFVDLVEEEKRKLAKDEKSTPGGSSDDSEEELETDGKKRKKQTPKQPSKKQKKNSKKKPSRSESSSPDPNASVNIECRVIEWEDRKTGYTPLFFPAPGPKVLPKHHAPTVKYVVDSVTRGTADKDRPIDAEKLLLDDRLRMKNSKSRSQAVKDLAKLDYTQASEDAIKIFLKDMRLDMIVLAPKFIEVDEEAEEEEVSVKASKSSTKFSTVGMDWMTRFLDVASLYYPYCQPYKKRPDILAAVAKKMTKHVKQADKADVSTCIEMVKDFLQLEAEAVGYKPDPAEAAINLLAPIPKQDKSKALPPPPPSINAESKSKVVLSYQAVCLGKEKKTMIVANASDTIQEVFVREFNMPIAKFTDLEITIGNVVLSPLVKLSDVPVLINGPLDFKIEQRIPPAPRQGQDNAPAAHQVQGNVNVNAPDGFLPLPPLPPGIFPGGNPGVNGGNPGQN